MKKKTYKRSEVARCYRVCFTDPKTGTLTQEGKVVMKDLQAMGRLDDDTFDENPYTMAMLSGCMKMANRVFHFIFTPAEVFEKAEEDIEVNDDDAFLIGNQQLNEDSYE